MDGGIDINSYNGQYKIEGDYGIQTNYANTTYQATLPVKYDNESHNTADLSSAQPYHYGGGNGYYQTSLQQTLNQEFGTNHMTPIQTGDPSYVPLHGNWDQDAEQKKKLATLGPHICDICNKEFSSYPSLKRHRETHTGQKKFACELCGNCYTQKHNLTKHMRLHTGEKPYKCNMCDKAFYIHHHLKNHMFQHTGDYPYPCPECGRGFKTKAKMETHLLRHTKTNGDRAMTRSPPSVGINSEENSMSEIWDNLSESVNDETLNDESEYNTEDMMDDSFDEELRLEEHECEICQQIFINAESLNNHIKLSHNVNEEFKCDHCGSIFLTPVHLARHRKVHAEKGGYRCEDCNASFRFKVSLHIHMRRHNNDFKRYECNLCNKYFMSKMSLKKHVNEHYGLTIFQCDECGEEFDQKAEFKAHILSHSEKEESPKRRPTCSICLKSFCSNSSLRKHSYTHMDEKPHKCNLCSMSFAQKIQLKLHSKRHNGGILESLPAPPPPVPPPVFKKEESSPQKTENGPIKIRLEKVKKVQNTSPNKTDNTSQNEIDDTSLKKIDNASPKKIENTSQKKIENTSPKKRVNVFPIKEENVPPKKQSKDTVKNSVKEDVVPERRNAPRKARNALHEKREAENKVDSKPNVQGRRNTPRKARNVIKEEENEEEESSSDSSDDSDSDSDDSDSDSEADSENNEDDPEEEETIEERLEKSKLENEKNAAKSAYRYPVCEKCNKMFKKKSALKRHQKYCR